jgi:hypothetical protein
MAKYTGPPMDLTNMRSLGMPERALSVTIAQRTAFISVSRNSRATQNATLGGPWHRPRGAIGASLAGAAKMICAFFVAASA